jgi:UDP-3-O-[3-hydroxymyristoyl] glucosamine N-acyltransferase
MQVTLADLAVLINGELNGDGGIVIHGAAPLGDAQPGQITLVDGVDKGQTLASCRASAVITPRGFAPEQIATIQVDNVHVAFIRVMHHFRPPRVRPRLGISPMAVIDPSAKLGTDVDVHPFATIEGDVEIGAGSTINSGVRIMAGSRIGENVTIFPNAVLYEDTIVGPRCVIHAGAVLGAYGFGYCCVEGRHRMSAQLGNVVLGADVEIGANTTIDRGTYGSTIIGEGTKIDNQVMVAHNCRVGRHNLLCSQVGIAGSTTTGDYVVMAGQVGVRDHVHIGDRVMLGAMAGVMNDVPSNARWVGVPATPEREQMVKQVALAKLPEMRKQMKMLQATVDKLVGRTPDLNASAAKEDVAQTNGNTTHTNGSCSHESISASKEEQTCPG